MELFEYNFQSESHFTARDFDSLSYPRLKQIQIDISEQTIDMMDFLKIGECEFSRLIGEHNSILSKLEGPSERLFYNLEFYRLYERCDFKKIKKSEIFSKIQNVYRLKKKSLDDYAFNATFGSKEFKEFFSVHSSFPTLNELKEFYLENPTGYFLTLKNHLQKNKTSKSDFNRYLGILNASQMGGRVLKAMQLFINYFEKMNLQSIPMNCKVIKNKNQLIQDFLLLTDYIEKASTEIYQIHQFGKDINFEKTLFYKSYWIKNWHSQKSTYFKFLNESKKIKFFLISKIKSCK